MNEAEFISEIDCAFPYADRRRALELVSRAASISLNAVGMVLNEIAHAPRGDAAPGGIRLEVLARIEELVPHPMIEIVAPIVRRVIAGDRLTEDETIEAMRRIEPFDGQCNVLMIIESACADSSEALDAESERILNVWRKPS